MVLRLGGYNIILRSHIGKYISSDKIVAEVNAYVCCESGRHKYTISISTVVGVNVCCANRTCKE